MARHRAEMSEYGFLYGIRRSRCVFNLKASHEIVITPFRAEWITPAQNGLQQAARAKVSTMTWQCFVEQF